jgi:Protein of unknown function (DUF1569)
MMARDKEVHQLQNKNTEMKTIFDRATREEVVNRINSLTENSKAQWGKMNVHQMIRHCILCEEMFLGRKKYKRAFIGRLFGRIGLKNFLKDEKPLGHNAPTGPDFKIQETGGDINSEKSQWISLIGEYGHYSNIGFVHWFFGKMTPGQIGNFDYKHIDHHLRQFNA